MNTKRESSESVLNSMRLDLFLKRCRLIPRRSVAQQVCDKEAIRVNGQTAKSGKSVRVGDIIEWTQHQKITTIKVTGLPGGIPSKLAAEALYQRLDH